MPEYRKFGKELASTRVEVRDQAISELSEYLASTELPYIEYVKIWKGLFYCIFYIGMWMADGREYQQNLTDRLVDLFDQASDKFNWLNAFYESMRTEWDGIDIHRVDKYMTLVRAYVLASLDWAQNNLDQWIELLNTLLNRATGKGLGLAIHIADVYIEEMGDVDYELAMKLVDPFLKMIVNAKLPHIVTGFFKRIMERLATKYPGNEEFKKFVWEQASTSNPVNAKARELLYDLYARMSGMEIQREEQQDEQATQKKKKKKRKRTTSIPDALQKVMDTYYSKDIVPELVSIEPASNPSEFASTVSPDSKKPKTKKSKKNESPELRKHKNEPSETQAESLPTKKLKLTPEPLSEIPEVSSPKKPNSSPNKPPKVIVESDLPQPEELTTPPRKDKKKKSKGEKMYDKLLKQAASQAPPTAYTEPEPESKKSKLKSESPKVKETSEEAANRRKVNFNLKNNITKRNLHSDFDKTHVISDSRDFSKSSESPAPKRGVLKSTGPSPVNLKKFKRIKM